MKIPGAWRFKKTWIQMNQLGFVLMYHRITDAPSDPWKICVKPKNFQEHLAILKKYTRPVKFTEIGNHLRGISFLQRKRIALTFDDGYGDNFHHAKPMLEQQGIPGTFFIVSGAVNSKEEYWWDELERIILSSGKLPNQFELNMGGANYRWLISSQIGQPNMDYSQMSMAIPPNNAQLSQIQLYYILWEILSHFSLPEKKSILKLILKWSQTQSQTRLSYLPMTQEELVSLSKSSLFEIGGHTVNHPMLSRLPPNDQEHEIQNSKKTIEDVIGRRITSFAYPHGQYNDGTIKIMERLKFKAACTVIAEPVIRNNNPYLLPRFNVLDWDGKQFEKELKKWLNFGY